MSREAPFESGRGVGTRICTLLTQADEHRADYNLPTILYSASGYLSFFIQQRRTLIMGVPAISTYRC